jgi:hypothetical protein
MLSYMVVRVIERHIYTWGESFVYVGDLEDSKCGNKI